MPTQAQTLSIIVNNYNHAAFVADAIASALAFARPQTEVIVVDDGSTDGSRSVIAGFGERIKTLFLTNGGQLAACVRAVESARGDYIYFLDADDMIRPGFAVAVEAALATTPAPAKIQFQLQSVDAAGLDLASCFPSFRKGYNAAAMRRDMQVWGQYVSPPTSGNIFSRRLLRNAWSQPIDYERAVDGIALYLAPYMGPVVSIPQPLASYRLHGANLHQQHVLDPCRMERESARVRARLRHLASLTSDFAPDPALTPGLCLENTIYAHVARSQPVRKLISAFLPRLWRAHFSPRYKMAVSVWAVAVAASPKVWRVELCRWRLSPLNRPAWITRLLSSRAAV